MKSIQYGLKLPRDGIFGYEDRDTLAAEAERLEDTRGARCAHILASNKLMICAQSHQPITIR